VIADDPSAPALAAAAAIPIAQQAQHWLGSISELVSYVESKAKNARLQAQQAHQGSVHAQLSQLQVQLQQQTAQLHSQAQELKVLRALQPSSGTQNGSRGAQLYQELQRRQQVGERYTRSCAPTTLTECVQLQVNLHTMSGAQQQMIIIEQTDFPASAWHHPDAMLLERKLCLIDSMLS
jgi:hypothetical protein